MARAAAMVRPKNHAGKWDRAGQCFGGHCPALSFRGALPRAKGVVAVARASDDFR